MKPIPGTFETRRLQLRRLRVPMSTAFAGLYQENAFELMKKWVLPDTFNVALIAHMRQTHGKDEFALKSFLWKPRDLIEHHYKDASSLNGIISSGDVQTWIRNCQLEWRKKEKYTWGVYLKHNQTAPVGVVQIMAEKPSDGGVHTHGGFCFWLDQSARRQRLIPEALQKTMSFMGQAGFRTVEITTQPDNGACLSIARKLGFRKKPVGLYEIPNPEGLMTLIKGLS